MGQGESKATLKSQMALGQWGHLGPWGGVSGFPLGLCPQGGCSSERALWSGSSQRVFTRLRPRGAGS